MADARSDPAGGQPEQGVLVIAADRDGSSVVVALTGEMDMNGAESFTAEVRRLVAEGVRVLVVDLDGLSFVDSAGLQALWTVREQVEAAGVTFRIVRVSPMVARVIRVAGVESLLPDEGTAAT